MPEPLPEEFEGHIERAKAANREGRNSAAFDGFRCAFRCLDRTSPRHRQHASEVCVYLADIYLVRGQRGFAAFLACTGLHNLPDGDLFASARLRAHGVLGIHAWYRNDLAAAKVIFERMAQAAEDAADIPRTQKADAWSNLGLAHQALDRWLDAAEAQQKAENHAVAGGDSNQIFSVRLRLSNALQDAGLSAASRALLEQIEPGDGDPDKRLRWLNAFALLEERFGTYKTACDAFDEAQALFDDLTPVAQSTMVNVLSNSAHCKLALGHVNEAEDLSARLCEVVVGTQVPYACRKGALELNADIAWHEGRTQDAEEYLAELEHLTCNVTGSRSDDYVSAVCDRARLISNAGERKRALDHLKELIDGGTDGFDGLSLVPVLTHLGSWALREGDTSRAGEWLGAAFATEATRGQVQHLYELYAALGALAETNGAANAAVLFTKLALELVAEKLRPFKSNRFELAALSGQTSQTVSMLVSQLLAANRLGEAGRAQNRHMAQRATVFAAKGIGDLKSFGGVSLRADEATVTGRLKQFYETARKGREANAFPRLEASPPDATGVSAEEGDAATLLVDILSEAWVEQGETGAEQFEDTVIEAAPDTLVLKFLPGRTALVIEYATSEDHGHVLKEIDGAALRSTIFDLVVRVSAKDALWRGPAGELYDVLVRPVEHLAAGKTRLLIAANGPIASVPFACLSSGTALLGDSHEIALWPGVGRGRASGFDPGVCRALAAGSDTYARLPSLPRIGRELEAVQRRFARTTVLHNEGLTEEALIDALAMGPDVVHLAGHFNLVPEDIDRSWFALGSDRTFAIHRLRDDRIDLGAARLVWLSACDTGVQGHSRAGPESLAQLLARKGARTVIASLWPVSDTSTVLLAERFYAALDATGPAAALRRAQSSLRDGVEGDRAAVSDPPDLSHPYHWAGFTVYSA